MPHVIIIGGGPGGTAAATRASQLGAQVTLVEKELLGGGCVNYNCIPFAGMMASVELLTEIRRASEMGITVGEPQLDLGKARERVSRIVQELREGIAGLMASFGVEVVEGQARLLDQRTISVGEHRFTADAIILATGAHQAPTPFPVDGLLDHKEALALTQVPERLLVWGGWKTPVEYAQYFALLGSRVTLVTETPTLFPEEDYEIGQRMQTILGGQGVHILTGATVRSARQQNGSVRAAIGQRKGETAVDVDRVLWLRREPTVEGLGLEQAGVKVVEGAIQIDDMCRTSAPGVYAIGDAAGRPFYSSVATYRGLIAAENALGRKRRTDLRYVPRIAGTLPEVGCVGLTEEQAEDQGHQVEIVNVAIAANSRAMTLAETEGGIKIVYDKPSGKLLGVHIVGHRAGELVSEAALALQMEVLAEDYAWSLRGHPTISESLVDMGRAFFGQALYIPKF